MNERKEHLYQVERWALFVREHPTEWKKPHTEFINALFDKHEQFKERLLKTPGGKEKFEKLYGNKRENRS
jgi:hypothetical protein